MLFRKLLIILLLIIFSNGLTIARTTMTEEEAKVTLQHCFDVLRMTNMNVQSTSYTVEYKIKDVNSPGFLTENPFWTPQSVGDHEIKTIQNEGDISVILTTAGIYIDKLPLRSIGTKEDGSTKSILYGLPAEIRIWRSNEGKVYENLMPRTFYKVFTNTRITTDSYIIDDLLLAGILWPRIMNEMVPPENLTHRKVQCDLLTSETAIISIDLDQMAFGQPIKSVNVINLSDFTSPEFYVIRPDDSSGGQTRVTQTYQTFAEKDGITYINSERYALPLDPPFADSLFEWHMKFPPEFNRNFEIPIFTTAPQVMDETNGTGGS